MRAMRVHGIGEPDEVVVLDDPECKRLMDEFIERYPTIWNEDIGEE